MNKEYCMSAAQKTFAFYKVMLAFQLRLEKYKFARALRDRLPRFYFAKNAKPIIWDDMPATVRERRVAVALKSETKQIAAAGIIFD